MDHLGRQVLGTLPRASRDAVVSRRVLSALGRRAPLTILRASRGYGKTTAIGRWLEACDVPIRTVYCALDRTAQLEGGFWQQLGVALVDAGVPLGSTETALHAREDVLAALSGYDEALRLVIDNFHEAGHLAGRRMTDDDLLDVIRGNDQLEVVIATRSLSPLETVGALSVDLTVVRPSDLALQAPAVSELAASRGLVLNEDQATHLVMELGGWPAAIRSCLDAAAVSGSDATVEGTLVDGFLDTLLLDLRSAALREFLMRTAVPEEFSAAAASVILPGGHAMRDLRNLLLDGILKERDTIAGLRYSYPPAIRESLARITADRRPELVREVHLALMAVAAREGGPIDVLTHAVHAQEWDIAQRVLDEEWGQLVSRHQHELIELIRHFPPERLATDPQLAVVSDKLHRMPTLPWGGGAAWTPTTPAFLDDALRLRGRGRDQGGRDTVSVLLRAGTAAVFTGDNAAAVYAFGRARDLGIAQQDHSAELLGVTSLLLTNAIAGDVELALSWARDPALDGLLIGVHAVAAVGLSEIASVGARIGVAIAYADGGRAEAQDAIGQLIEPHRRDELWSLGIYARGLYASVFGSAHTRGQAAGALRAAMRHLEPGGLTEATLGTALVELLVVDGRTDLAAQVLDRLPASHVSDPTRALLRLAQHREDDAIRTADRVLGDPRLTARGRHLCETVVAVALSSKGQATAARRRFGRAVQVARETGQSRAFALFPRAVVAELTGGDPAVLSVVGHPTGRSDGAPAGRYLAVSVTSQAQSHNGNGSGPVRDGGSLDPTGISRDTPGAWYRGNVTRSAGSTPDALSADSGAEPGSAVALTEREREVLAALRDNPGPSGVATALGLSVNTAKTHVRSVYRKLGAANREEALLLAGSLLGPLG